MWGYNSKGYMFEPEIILEYFAIGIILLVLFFVIKYLAEDKKKLHDLIAGIFLGFYILLIPMTFYASYKLKEIPWNTEIDSSYDLVSMVDNNLTNSYGYKRVKINEELYYQYLYHDEGGISQGQIPAKVTKIKFDNNCRIESYNLNRSWLLWWQKDKSYILYVPEDTVKTEFLIDLN